MSLARYFVVQNRDQWLVTLEGVAMSRHASQKEAIGSAIVMADLMGAMHHDADVMIQVKDRLELIWTYGQDPLPRRAAAVPKAVAARRPKAELKRAGASR